MNVSSIIKKYLKDNGFDGLVNCDADCGCLLDDLFPCDYPTKGCEAAYNEGPVGSYDFFMVHHSKWSRPIPFYSPTHPRWCARATKKNEKTPPPPTEEDLKRIVKKLSYLDAKTFWEVIKSSMGGLKKEEKTKLLKIIDKLPKPDDIQRSLEKGIAK